LIAARTKINRAAAVGTRSNGLAHPAASHAPEAARLKILFMIDHLHGFGGTEKHLFQLVQHLNPQKFSCYLLALDGRPEVLRLYAESSCHVLPHALARIYDHRALRLARKLVRFLKDEHIDIVQTFHFGSDTFGAIVARRAGVPLLISSRRDLGTYRTGYFKLIDRMTYPLFHHYISVCGAVSETLIADGIARDKITEIPNGVDLSTWPEPDEQRSAATRCKLNLDTETFVIGNLSHFRPEKGHATFFAALRKVSAHIPKLKVYALGAGNQRLEQVIAQDRVLKAIIIADKVADVREYLPAFDIACLTPVTNEGFSNALLEEMAAGKPIIATDVGGNREAIIDGETGFVVPPGNEDAIAERILQLYRDPELRRTMGAQARQHVEAQFSLKKMISRMEDLYQSLFERSKS